VTLLKLKVFDLVRYASSGGPDDCSVACVVDGIAEGLTRCVLGIWSRKRAAVEREAKEAKEAKAAMEVFIAVQEANWVRSSRDVVDDRRLSGLFDGSILKVRNKDLPIALTCDATPPHHTTSNFSMHIQELVL